MVRVAALAAVLTMACPSAGLAQDAGPDRVPRVVGNYVFTRIVSCFTSELSVSHWNAVANFHPKTGMVSIEGYFTLGEPPVLHTVSQNLTFSNTATSITIDGVEYKAFYGKRVQGVATYLSYLGTVPASGGGCAVQVALSRMGDL